MKIGSRVKIKSMLPLTLISVLLQSAMVESCPFRRMSITTSPSPTVTKTLTGVVKNLCEVNPCKNDGLCKDNNGTLACLCEGQSTGTYCEHRYCKKGWWYLAATDHCYSARKYVKKLTALQDVAVVPFRELPTGPTETVAIVQGENTFIFSQAQERCDALGAKLVSINSMEELNFTLDVFNKNGMAWIGLRETVAGSDDYVWEDGTSLNLTKEAFTQKSDISNTLCAHLTELECMNLMQEIISRANSFLPPPGGGSAGVPPPQDGVSAGFPPLSADASFSAPTQRTCGVLMWDISQKGIKYVNCGSDGEGTPGIGHYICEKEVEVVTAG